MAHKTRKFQMLNLKSPLQNWVSPASLLPKCMLIKNANLSIRNLANHHNNHSPLIDPVPTDFLPKLACRTRFTNPSICGINSGILKGFVTTLSIP